MMMQYEFEQMQDCITALFDCFERVTLDGQPLEQSLRKLIQQNISFARKMVELSEKFDELYTRQSQQLNEEIHTAIKKLYGMLPGNGKHHNLAAVDMLEVVAEQLLKKSINSRQNRNMRQSQKKRDRSETENNMPVSKTNRKPASMPSDKSISLKEALSLKRSLQLEEQTIRELFDSANRMIADSQLTSPQSNQYKYHKHYAQQQDASSVMTLVKGNLDSNSINLQHLKSLLQLMTDDVLKSLRKRSVNTDRVNLCLSQIQKREEVFSYTISKILQSFRTFTSGLDSRHQSKETLQNMEELLNKLFDIYPSADILKDIHLYSPQSKQRNIQEYISNSKQVQVNIKPHQKDANSREGKKQQIELFRMGVRMNESIQKLAEAIKFKKTMDVREIDKWLDGFRDSLTTIQQHRPSIAKDVQAGINIFEEQYKRIQTENEVRETEIKSQYAKIIGKCEKALKTCEQQSDQLKVELNKSEERHIKLTKKLDHKKQQVAKVKVGREQLEKTIQSQHHQLEQLRSMMKTQQKQQSKQTKIARSQQQLVSREKERIEEELRRIAKSLQYKQLSVEQQRNIYRSKTKLIEKRQEEISTQNGRLKQELQVMIIDNRVLKERVEHLGQMQEEKIRQSEQLIEQFKKMEGQLSQKELEFREARVEITSLKESISQIDQELAIKGEDHQKLMQEKLRCEDNAKKYKQLGRLNEQDIQILKEQIEKVKNAYFEAEEQLASLKEAYETLKHEKIVLTDTKHKYSEILADMESDLQEQRKFRDRSEEAIRLANQELRLKEKELNDLHSSIQVYKEDRKELARLKKDNAQLRNSLNTAELKLATIKHDIQNAALLQQTTFSQQRRDLKAQNAKYQLEVETLRVDLKNKKEIIEKDRINFDREKGILLQKINDLKILISEKQNLSNRLKLAKHYESIHQVEQNNSS